MLFNIKRFIYGVSKHRFWLLLVFLPPIFYVVMLAGTPDRFTLQQKISISKDLALPSGSGGLIGIKDVVSHPDDFFLNNFAVRRLFAELYPGTAVYRADLRFRNLLNTIKDNMHIEMPAEKLVMISFFGKDKETGQTAVNYYSQRFIQKAKEGLDRSAHKELNAKLPVLIGTVEINAHHSLWRSERLLPLMLIGFISLNAILVLLVVIEWSDPSLKSERQVAQYLELPILGSLPDLNKISAALDSKREGLERELGHD
jgi:hypothetical protein